jgi:hypothetical protein
MHYRHCLAPPPPTHNAPIPILARGKSGLSISKLAVGAADGTELQRCNFWGGKAIRWFTAHDRRAASISSMGSLANLYSNYAAANCEMSAMIDYQIEPNLSADEFIDELIRSSLSGRDAYRFESRGKALTRREPWVSERTVRVVSSIPMARRFTSFAGRPLTMRPQFAD